MSQALVHGAPVGGLAVALGIACAAALPGGAAMARLPATGFMAVVVVLAALILPDLGLVLLGPGGAATVALAALLLPLFAWGWRRCPVAERREARRLGASPALVLRLLVVPALAPLAAAAVAIAVALLAARWALSVHPAPILVPYPAVETG